MLNLRSLSKIQIIRRIGVAGAALVTLACLFGPLFLSHSPNQTFADDLLLPPDFEAGFFCGADAHGRDLLVRTLHAGRWSLFLMSAATILSLVFGSICGVLTLCHNHRVATISTRIIRQIEALPFPLIAALLTIAAERNLLLMTGAISLLAVPTLTRMIQERGATTPRFSVAFFTLQATPPTLMICLTGQSFLSFLGFGTSPQHPTWGALIREGATAFWIAPWTFWTPTGVLTATLLFLLLTTYGAVSHSPPPSENRKNKR
ncbi:membrane hypothetical protein [Azospirillaceae bacterium]